MRWSTCYNIGRYKSRFILKRNEKYIYIREAFEHCSWPRRRGDLELSYELAMEALQIHMDEVAKDLRKFCPFVVTIYYGLDELSKIHDFIEDNAQDRWTMIGDRYSFLGMTIRADVLFKNKDDAALFKLYWGRVA